MDRILSLLLILASDPAADQTNEGRYLHNPNCGYACIFPQSTRDKGQDVEEPSAKLATGGNSEGDISIARLPSETEK
jgi:hypothetical protein